MKTSTFGAVTIFAVLASTSVHAAATDGYDPLALDNFVSQSLASTQPVQTMPSAVDLMQGAKPTVVAQDTLRYDADGYLVGPDGKRLLNPIKQRWRVGVFR